MHEDVVLLSGSSHKSLAARLAKTLGVRLGKIDLETFPDGEISVKIQDKIAGKDILLLQSIVYNPNFYLIELLIMIDALKRGYARSINLILPYVGYCRQDRKNSLGEPITASLVANLLDKSGIHTILTINLHSDQIEGFFEIPITNLSLEGLLAKSFKQFLKKEGSFSKENLIVVAPDIGNIKLVRNFADQLGVNLAIIDKRRCNHSEIRDLVLIGEVKGKNVIIVDDMCTTAKTIVSAAKLCKKAGGRRIWGAVVHGLFVGEALKEIAASALEKMIVTDTVPNKPKIASKIEVISIQEPLSQALTSSFNLFPTS